jgi:hypothetical protein
VIEFLILPFFFPLLLIGWVIDDHPIAASPGGARSERERERLFHETWLPIHGSADELLALR